MLTSFSFWNLQAPFFCCSLEVSRAHFSFEFFFQVEIVAKCETKSWWRLYFENQSSKPEGKLLQSVAKVHCTHQFSVPDHWKAENSMGKIFSTIFIHLTKTDFVQITRRLCLFFSDISESLIWSRRFFPNGILGNFLNISVRFVGGQKKVLIKVEFNYMEIFRKSDDFYYVPNE